MPNIEIEGIMLETASAGVIGAPLPHIYISPEFLSNSKIVPPDLPLISSHFDAATAFSLVSYGNSLTFIQARDFLRISEACHSQFKPNYSVYDLAREYVGVTKGNFHSVGIMLEMWIPLNASHLSSPGSFLALTGAKDFSDVLNLETTMELRLPGKYRQGNLIIALSIGQAHHVQHGPTPALMINGATLFSNVATKRVLQLLRSWDDLHFQILNRVKDMLDTNGVI